MRIAIITTGGRDLHKRWKQPGLQLGSAVNALLQGFAQLPEHEIHVLMAMRRGANPPWTQGNTTFHDVPTPNWGMMKSLYLGAANSLRKRLRQIQPDLVHGQGTERECGIGAVLSGFPNLITIHGNMRLIAKVNRVKPFTHAWVGAQLESLTIPRAGGVVCISRHTQKIVGTSARKTWVVPNPVEEEFFSIKREPTAATTILCIGNILRLKNQNALIRALDPIAQKMPVDIMFLGSAAKSDPCVKEFNALIETRPWCRHIGYADRNTVRQSLLDARFLILPSLEENCPMVILEAMAVGLPVVAAKIGGIPDLIEPDVTGVLFDPESPDSIQTAVTGAIANPERMEEMALTAQRRAFDLYHPEKVAARHLEVYREVLS